MRIRSTVLPVLPSVFVSFIALGGCHTMPSEAEHVHVTTSFHFNVQAPFSRTSLLFGPESEKGWAGERWKPRFFYPQPGRDVEGVVFEVQHGPHTSIWVNTVYDVDGGRMQYVAIIPEIVATTVDVELARTGQNQTRVDVTYVRTALKAAANDDVRSMARHDATSGPEWQNAIDRLLAASSNGRK